MQIKLLLILLLNYLGIKADDEYSDNNYGKTWIYFPSSDNAATIAYFTVSIPGKQITEMDLANQIEFDLYTRSNSYKVRKFRLNYLQKPEGLKIVKEQILANLDTKILVHGWMSNQESFAVTMIRDKYIETDLYNIITVNWSSLAMNSVYPVPAEQTKLVGETTAKMLNLLIQEGSINPQHLHLIGHSLGAHVVGFAGANIQNGGIQRITGLDPASPGFEYLVMSKEHLNKTNAEFVDVIHTCAPYVGFIAPIGDVDFYPNYGGPVQPGCDGIVIQKNFCSHTRSFMYFAESIGSTNQFYGYPCESMEQFRSGKCISKNVVIMGDMVPRTAKGIYYLRTRADSPFSLGLDGAL